MQDLIAVIAVTALNDYLYAPLLPLFLFLFFIIFFLKSVLQLRHFSRHICARAW